MTFFFNHAGDGSEEEEPRSAAAMLTMALVMVALLAGSAGGAKDDRSLVADPSWALDPLQQHHHHRKHQQQRKRLAPPAPRPPRSTAPAPDLVAAAATFRSRPPPPPPAAAAVTKPFGGGTLHLSRKLCFRSERTPSTPSPAFGKLNAHSSPPGAFVRNASRLVALARRANRRLAVHLAVIISRKGSRGLHDDDDSPSERARELPALGQLVAARAALERDRLARRRVPRVSARRGCGRRVAHLSRGAAVVVGRRAPRRSRIVPRAVVIGSFFTGVVCCLARLARAVVGLMMMVVLWSW